MGSYAALRRRAAEIPIEALAGRPRSFPRRLLDQSLGDGCGRRFSSSSGAAFATSSGRFVTCGLRLSRGRLRVLAERGTGAASGVRATAAMDDFSRRRFPSIYCAGEVAGIGGVDQAIVEGQIAGLAAAGDRTGARTLFSPRAKARRFARALEVAFALRSELRGLAEPDTIVCRCEDVPLSRLRTADSWRSAKLHSAAVWGRARAVSADPRCNFCSAGSGIHPPPFFPARQSCSNLLLQKGNVI